MKNPWISRDIPQTWEHARHIAEHILPGAIILLEGDLGAGKTEWVKGFVAALGCQMEVTSPTFNLVHEYLGGKWPIFHWDLYRLDSKTDWSVLDLETHLSSRSISIIEWPERYPNRWPAQALRVRLRIISENQREIICSA